MAMRNWKKCRGLYTPPPIPGGFRSENRNPTGISGIQVFFFWCNCHYIDQFRVQFLQPESPESDGTQKLNNKQTGHRIPGSMALLASRHLSRNCDTVTQASLLLLWCQSLKHHKFCIAEI